MRYVARGMPTTTTATTTTTTSTTTTTTTATTTTTTYYLLPTTYYLLPTTYYLLPTTYYLLPTTYYLLPTTYYLLPTTYYLLPTTYYLLPTTYYLLPTTYYLLPTTVGSTKGRRGLCLRYPLIHQRVLNPRTLNQVPKYPVPNTWSSRARPFCNDGRVTSVASTRQPLLPCQRLEPKSSCETETTDAFSYYTTKGPKLTKHLLT